MIHVHTWSAARNARITDMSNAGKRGKTCKVLRFSGAPWDAWSGTTDAQRAAIEHTTQIMGTLGILDCDGDFSAVESSLDAMIHNARADGVPESYVALYREEIRGVDAPVHVLTASGPGFTASADDSGISIHDTIDQNNMPCMITSHTQKDSQAYKLAAKVWEKVKAATSFHDAGDILSAAGCKLHYFCRMD